MSAEQNKAVVRRYAEEVVGQGKLSVVDELFSEHYVGHVSGFPLMNRETDKQFVAMLRTAFPDLEKVIEDLIADGDRVVDRSTYQGTHQGLFQGIPPTGRKVKVQGINIFRFEDGRVAETWTVVDNLGMMQQLGVIPAPDHLGSQRD